MLSLEKQLLGPPSSPADPVGQNDIGSCQVEEWCSLPLVVILYHKEPDMISLGFLLMDLLLSRVL